MKNKSVFQFFFSFFSVSFDGTLTVHNIIKCRCSWNEAAKVAGDCYYVYLRADRQTNRQTETKGNFIEEQSRVCGCVCTALRSIKKSFYFIILVWMRFNEIYFARSLLSVLLVIVFSTVQHFGRNSEAKKANNFMVLLVQQYSFPDLEENIHLRKKIFHEILFTSLHF
jgi:hypothetical protein